MQKKRKVALITGGTHGIGAATARQLASSGYDLVLVARNNSPDFTRELEAYGGNVLMVTADVADECACKEVVDTVEQTHGRLDSLIHLAGGPVSGGLSTLKTEVWYHAFSLHLHAVFHLCQAALPLMRRNGEGNVVMISSAAGMRGVRNALAYAVVKGAIPQFVRALAFELAEYSIRVNCISPGVIRTRFQDILTTEQVKNNIQNRIPLRCEGTPQQVADVIFMLLSNQYITGQNIVVDGGLTMRIA